MPVFEYACRACGTVEERFVKHWDDPVPCPGCGVPQEKLFSRFASPFSGSIHKYVDLNRENGHIDGWWAYRTRSSVSGQPEPVYLDSMSAVREFNKAEGLAAPGEVPTYSTVSADGRRIESRGMPGQWTTGVPEMPARLREMVSTPAEQCVPMPATSRPSMPMDFGIKPEVTAAPAEVGG